MQHDRGIPHPDTQHLHLPHQVLGVLARQPREYRQTFGIDAMAARAGGYPPVRTALLVGPSDNCMGR